ncbi:MAG: hypothetical protein IKH54_02315 [Bacilli bacterium]|nr:hypothetical protein [Bacilli bacterium]
MMFNSDNGMLSAFTDDPLAIFTMIKQGEFEIIQLLIEKNKINVNLCDSVGNDVVTRLLKAKQYDMVIQLMKKRNWDVNHQNVEGNTFGHILAQDNSVSALKVVEQLTKKKNFLPNIQNNKGETILDLAINNNYLCTAFKFLEDKRFNNIDVNSFQKLFNVCIKNTYYGKYTKLNNLEIIVNNLEKKELMPGMKELIDEIKNNMTLIKEEILNNKSNSLETLIMSSLNTVAA